MLGMDVDGEDEEHAEEDDGQGLGANGPVQTTVTSIPGLVFSDESDEAMEDSDGGIEEGEPSEEPEDAITLAMQDSLEPLDIDLLRQYVQTDGDQDIIPDGDAQLMVSVGDSNIDLENFTNDVIAPRLSRVCALAKRIKTGYVVLSTLGRGPDEDNQVAVLGSWWACSRYNNKLLFETAHHLNSTKGVFRQPHTNALLNSFKQYGPPGSLSCVEGVEIPSRGAPTSLQIQKLDRYMNDLSAAFEFLGFPHFIAYQRSNARDVRVLGKGACNYVPTIAILHAVYSAKTPDRVGDQLTDNWINDGGEQPVSAKEMISRYYRDHPEDDDLTE